MVRVKGHHPPSPPALEGYSYHLPVLTYMHGDGKPKQATIFLLHLRYRVTITTSKYRDAWMVRVNKQPSIGSRSVKGILSSHFFLMCYDRV